MEKETSWFCLIFQSEDLLLRHLYFLHIIIIIIILRGISSAHDKFSIKSNTFKNKAIDCCHTVATSHSAFIKKKRGFCSLGLAHSVWL